MPFRERIALRMRELGLTQMELAQRSGLTQQAISKYVRGKSKPGFDAIVTLSSALEVNPAWFFNDQPAANPNGSPRQTMWSPSAGHHKTPKPETGDVIAFPTTGQLSRDARFVIGHWLPMQDFPSPTRVVSHGVMTNFYELVFNKLVQLIPPGQLRGGLAVNWKQIGRSWVFQLREGVRFHNGKLFSAEDVIWSYEQYLRYSSDNLIEGLETLDRHFVQIHLKSPCRLEELPMPFILPNELEGSKGEWIGTGPFRVVRLDPGFWQLTRNRNFFFFPPFLEEIHIREYPNPDTLRRALFSGEVHFAIGLYAPQTGVAVKSEPAALRYHMLFMLGEPLVKNPLVRKAIALGLDREALAQAMGLKEPLYSSGPFDYVLQDRSRQAPLPQKEIASQVLRQISELRDSPFRVRYYETDPQSRPLAEAVVQQLRGLGVSAEIGDPPSAILVNRPTERLEREYSSWASSGTYNLNGYGNPEVDRKIRELSNTTPTPSQLIELRRLIQTDLPDVPLFYGEMPITYVERLRALENRVILFSCASEIHTWYMEEDRAIKNEREAHVASLSG